MRAPTGKLRWALLVLAAISLTARICLAAGPLDPPRGMSRAEALQQGERMYREGMLPDGTPLQAIVEGDIPVDGSMFTCASCHMRSGLGSVEGSIISPPTNGVKLFQARKGGQEFTEHQRQHLPAHFRMPDIRPAYTAEKLAAVLRTGVDSGGRRIDPIMPRYLLDDRSADILVYYLVNLSSEISPGVTDTTIRLATVVSEDVSPAERDAMLLPLAAYVRDRSSKASYFKIRSSSRLFAEEMDRSYRGLALATWVLKGPPSAWGAQLERYYRQDPVFALVGGITRQDWTPVHRFCEANQIPCIMPVTERPVVTDTDWYTLYFSKGPFQEGEAAARFVKDRTGTVVQVYRRTDTGAALAAGFRDARSVLGLPQPEEVVLGQGEAVSAEFWADLAGRHRDGTLVVWLGSGDLMPLARITERLGTATIIASSTVLGQGLFRLPEQLRSRTFITYPYRLPDDRTRAEHNVRPWLKVKKIPASNIAISSKMYFLGTLLTDAFMHMKSDYYRDYFLDVIDMLSDESDTIANYPRLSFGPGQRYASKGCYIVQLTSGADPALVTKSDWVVH